MSSAAADDSAAAEAGAASAAAPAPAAAAPPAPPSAGGDAAGASGGGGGGAGGAGKKKKNRRAKKKAAAAAADESGGADGDGGAGTAGGEAGAASGGASGSGAGSGAAAGSTTSDAAAAAEQLTRERLVAMLRAQAAEAGSRAPKKTEEYEFWKTQPVLPIESDTSEHKAIDEDKTPADVKDEPYALPAGFVWSTVDVTKSDQLAEVYDLLTHNYVEDDDNMFRFDYSAAFLQWALLPPKRYPEWLVGVRQANNGKLRGFISGIPVVTHVHHKCMTMCEINFLCVHKKLRSKRLAPVLIKEVTRRVNKEDIWQAVYTAGVVLPKPVSSCRYYHRSLNPKKLVEVGFSQLKPRQTMSRCIRLHKLPDAPATPGLRVMTSADVPVCTMMLKEYLAKFKLWIEYDEAEFAHWLLPREGVVDSYVVENPETHELTDFFSFYNLPSSIIGNPKHSKLNAAYSYYYVAKGTPFVDLMRDQLILARDRGYDVFNALALLDNYEMLEELKFGMGDGNLNYYLYNWACPSVEDKEVGIVLL